MLSVGLDSDLSTGLCYPLVEQPGFELLPATSKTYHSSWGFYLGMFLLFLHKALVEVNPN